MLAFPIYKYLPLLCIVCTLYICVIAIYLNIINILDAPIVINLYFKGRKSCEEDVFFNKYIYIRNF